MAMQTGQIYIFGHPPRCSPGPGTRKFFHFYTPQTLEVSSYALSESGTREIPNLPSFYLCPTPPIPDSGPGTREMK